MNQHLFVLALLLSAISSTLASAQTLSLPVSEDFTADVADWGDRNSVNAANFNPLTFVDSGGSDGSSYASTQFAFSAGGGAGGSSAVLFRAHDEFGSSGSSEGAFIGDWILSGVQELSASVRHDAPVPISFFVRASGPANFPGATAIQFAPVLPNTWTEISFDLLSTSPQFVTFEGSNHSEVFSNIGHLQLGVSIPDGFDMNPAPFTFDLDQVTIVPEPTTLALLSIALAAVGGWRRKSL